MSLSKRDFALLQNLCEIHAPSGNEGAMLGFLQDYLDRHSSNWKQKPKKTMVHGNLVLSFGSPRTLVLAHMDSVGFTVRYENQLVPIGSPEARSGFRLKGSDRLGPIATKIKLQDDKVLYDFGRSIERGTDLTFDQKLVYEPPHLKGPYLDNRVGVFNALKLAEELKDGIIAFTTYEEHGGGSVPVILEYVMRQYAVKQVLISDITWVTDGVKSGDGVVISLRDRLIPRRIFIDKILALAERSEVPYQLEVEATGSSDGREVHHSPYALDWCFIGAAESHVHSPNETIHEADLMAMVQLYRYLLEEL